jgi:hypothetical protein
MENMAKVTVGKSTTTKKNDAASNQADGKVASTPKGAESAGNTLGKKHAGARRTAKTT